MERERFACVSCPAFFECSEDGLNATAGGWEKKVIDGKEIPCCIPAHFVGGRSEMQKYSFYCLATSRGKKIAGKADYTGNVPRWCPRLEKGA